MNVGRVLGHWVAELVVGETDFVLVLMGFVDGGVVLGWGGVSALYSLARIWVRGYVGYENIVETCARICLISL